MNFFEKFPKNINKNIREAGMTNLALSSKDGISTKLNVPTEKYKPRIATNMKALPSKVNITNFIAEYSFLPVPQIDIKKYIGNNSSSQNMKKRIRSRETKTPITAL